MPTNDEIRLDQIEKRLDKYDDIIEELRSAVTAIQANIDSNHRWITGILCIVCSVIGGTIGHLIWR
jgi:uncharacterized coiled-coil protein SlyX